METIARFKKIFDQAAYAGNYATVFDDFLTMCICAFSRNLKTGLSNYEDEYLEVIKPYKANKTLDYFPQMLAELISYMEENKDAQSGNDLLGEFFQQEITHGRGGQFFTPNTVTHLMSKIISGLETELRNVLDPCCGSGRMLISCARSSKTWNRYYGIDIDPVCVKMTAINMFLNGLRGEVICADALMPDDFRFGYRISFFPLEIFKIEKKEDSVLWKTNRASFEKKQDRESDNGQPRQLNIF